MKQEGICYLVGAGPGDLGLVTLKAQACVEAADIIFYDALANPQILEWARPEAEFVDVGKRAGAHALDQRAIEERLIQETRQGKKVVRLKGGDPFLFGRGAEEGEALKKAGCRFEVIPGITAALAASVYAGVPLTHRELASSVTLLTGHQDPSKAFDAIHWKELARSQSTLAIYMGVENLGRIAEQLMQAGMANDMSCALVEWATTSRQRVFFASLGELEKVAAEQRVQPPAILFVGKVCALKEHLNWLENKPLFGKRILLTRTRKQSSQVRMRLEAEGAEVFELPTIRIEPVAWDLKTADDHFDWLIFTSPNGVECFFKRYLQSHDVRELAGTRIAVIGPATADVLAAFGLRADWMPKRFTTEALAASWPGAAQKRQRALFACGNLAKKDIERALSEKGVDVERLEVYITTPEMRDRTALHKRLEKEGVDWIVFASSSAVENFHALHLKLPATCRHASFGPVTSAAMRRLGYSVDYESRTSQIDAFVQGLVQLYS